MNDPIENALQNSPKLKTPLGLVEKLKADISLPRQSAAVSEANGIGRLLHRWLPGFATAVLFLACLVAIGVQARVLSGLRHEQAQLASAAAEAQQVAETRRAEQERARLQAEQLARLQKDSAELQQLRAEVAQLREQSQQLAGLRAERERLAAQVKAMGSGIASDDPFAVAQDKANSIQCVSNMKQIGLAARMWANDHGEVMPPDFLTMRNELNSPKILTCPSDTARTKVSAWNEFGPANASYEFLVPNVSEREPPQTVMTRCPVHGHVGLLDGSVHQQPKAERLTQQNGRTMLQ